MADFPRTCIENISVSRMVIGTNWFLGYSHASAARDRFIKESLGRRQIADILEVFLRAGVDTLVGARPDAPQLTAAIADAEQRTGRKVVTITTPILKVQEGQADLDATARMLDEHAAMGFDICMPHQATTDSLVDRRLRRLTGMDRYLGMIRQRGMVPGLSTHMPETPIYADETNLDVASYMQIYNAAGFLMQIEVDWVHRMIWERAKPVLTLKPMAAGRLMPLVGLAFVWSTLRDIDMVAVGVLTPDEAREDIEISLSLLERRGPAVELQRTRSKASVTPAPAQG
ncbi:MAG TPA: hypothetical protein VMW52_05605 [Phycisphaerae bacterium]|nr:hypothetical protein [Phycisphaerae bacterium]